MKRIVYIASIVSLAVLAASCQKDEFEEVYETQNEKQELRSAESSIIDDDGSTARESIRDVAPTLEGGSFDKSRKNDPQNSGGILIKEVSDGDDEADGGDDSERN